MNIPLPSMDELDRNLQYNQTIIENSHGKGETILFVEDDELMREVGTQILEDLGYQVISASNGQEALKFFNETDQIDLIFTDIVMPEISGAALIEMIRNTGSKVKVIAVTGHILVEELDRLHEIGVSSIMQKPYDIDILAEAIREALDNE